MFPRWVNDFGFDDAKRRELTVRLSVIGDNCRSLGKRLRAAALATDRATVVKNLAAASESAALACYGLEYVVGMLEAQLARERRDNQPRSG